MVQGRVRTAAIRDAIGQPSPSCTLVLEPIGEPRRELSPDLDRVGGLVAVCNVIVRVVFPPAQGVGRDPVLRYPRQRAAASELGSGLAGGRLGEFRVSSKRRATRGGVAAMTMRRRGIRVSVTLLVTLLCAVLVVGGAEAVVSPDGRARRGGGVDNDDQ